MCGLVMIAWRIITATEIHEMQVKEFEDFRNAIRKSSSNSISQVREVFEQIKIVDFVKQFSIFSSFHDLFTYFIGYLIVVHVFLLCTF